MDSIQIKLNDLQVEDSEIDGWLEGINEAVERIDDTVTFVKQLATGDLEDVSTFDLALTIRKECKLVESQNDDIEFDIAGPATQVATTNQTTVLHVLANP